MDLHHTPLSLSPRSEQPSTETPHEAASPPVHPQKNASASSSDPSSLARRKSMPLEAQTFLDAPILPLTTATPLLSDFTAAGERQPHPSRTPIHIFQRYFIENRLIDKYRTTAIRRPHADEIHHKPPQDSLQETFLNNCVAPLLVDKDFDPPIRYAIHARGGQPHLEMACLDDIWYIYNGSMFSDIPVGECIARVHTFPSVVGNALFALVPNNSVLADMPPLKMEPVDGDPLGEYSLSVGRDKIIVGSLIVRRHFFDVVLRNCTKEEALIWLALVVVAELENKTYLSGLVDS